MTDTIDRPVDDGFEINGVFYPWRVSDIGKDLQLIDRFTGMPVAEFFETIEDSFDRERAPILLALIATSMRAKHPDWTVERLVRTVQNTPLSEIAFIDGDVEEQPVPPASGGEARPPSEAPSNGSSPSSTPAESSPARTSSETLV